MASESAIEKLRAALEARAAAAGTTFGEPGKTPDPAEMAEFTSMANNTFDVAGSMAGGIKAVNSTDAAKALKEIGKTKPLNPPQIEGF